MATDADAAAEAMAGMASGATATGQLAPKRKRGTALQAAENKVTELTIALDVALAEEVQAKAKAVERKTKAAITAAEKVAGKVVNVRAKLAVATEDLEKKQLAATTAKSVAEAKAKQVAEKEETNRPMTEQGLMALVEVRIKYQHRFDNSSDKSDSIWEHVRVDFMRRVASGALPPTDGRSTAALTKIFQRELGEFRLWNAIANRAVQLSGVPADRVEEDVKAHYRSTTSTFRRLNFGTRPMSAPPLEVSGDSAHRGGVPNGMGDATPPPQSCLQPPPPPPPPRPARSSPYVRPPVFEPAGEEGEEFSPELDEGDDSEGEESQHSPAPPPAGATPAPARAASSASSASGSSTSTPASAAAPTPLHIGGAGAGSGKAKQGAAVASAIAAFWWRRGLLL